MGVSHCGNKDFRFFCFCDLDLDLDPMTFIYKMTRIPWRYTGCVKMSFLSQGLRKLSSDRQTERHDRNYIPRRFAGGREDGDLEVK